MLANDNNHTSSFSSDFPSHCVVSCAKPDLHVVTSNSVDFDLSDFTHTYYENNLTLENTSFSLPYFPVDFRSVTPLVGGRLSYFYENYLSLTDNKFILSVIKDGYKIKFVNDQPPSLICNAEPFYLNLPPHEQAALDIEMQKFIDQHVVQEADPSTPGFYSPMFIREKRPDNENDSNAPKKYRIIHDLSLLNKSIVKYKFKMDSSRTVRAGLKQGMSFYSVDIQSAYNHILIHKSSRKYLRCWWRGRCYEFRALPFGLSSAPWIFTSVMAVSAKYLHRHGVYSFFYLDDINVFHKLVQKLINEQPLVLLFLQGAGWLINFPKSLLDVTQRGIYIGLDIDLEYGLVYPTQKRWKKLQSLIQVFLNRDVAVAREWASLLGVITCIQDLTPLGRVQARDLQYHVNSYWKDRTNLLQNIPLTSTVKNHLTWWLNPDNVMVGTPLAPGPITQTITTDASNVGWGGVWHAQEASGLWTDREKQFHINYLEALSVFYCLQKWEKHLTNSHLLVQTDNTTVVCHLNKGSGCHSLTQHTLIKEMLEWCHHRNITLTARHLPGKFNCVADQLSRARQIIPTEWTLRQAVVESIKQVWETPHLDLFATKLNHRLPLYMSPVQDPEAVAVDALSQDWTRMVAYAFPPFALIPQVLNKIELEQCIIYLIAPCWPRQAHFPLLMDLLVDIPLKLPDTPNLLSMPRSPIHHPDVKSLNLHVFKLSSMASLREDFLRHLRSISALNTNPQLGYSMKGTGNVSYVGVNSQGLKIPSKYLYVD